MEDDTRKKKRRKDVPDRNESMRKELKTEHGLAEELQSAHPGSVEVKGRG